MKRVVVLSLLVSCLYPGHSHAQDETPFTKNYTVSDLHALSTRALDDFGDRINTEINLRVCKEKQAAEKISVFKNSYIEAYIVDAYAKKVKDGDKDEMLTEMSTLNTAVRLYLVGYVTGVMLLREHMANSLNINEEFCREAKASSVQLLAE